MYTQLYPLAVQMLALVAALVTIVMSAWACIEIIRAKDSTDYPMRYRIIGGTFMFAGGCIAAMIILRIGVWMGAKVVG